MRQPRWCWPRSGSAVQAWRGSRVMFRTLGNRGWLLLAVSVTAWLLAPRRLDDRPAPATGQVTDDPPERPRMGLLVVAAILCTVLAVGIVGAIKVLQMREDVEVAHALTGGDAAKA